MIDVQNKFTYKYNLAFLSYWSELQTFRGVFQKDSCFAYVSDEIFVNSHRRKTQAEGKTKLWRHLTSHNFTSKLHCWRHTRVFSSNNISFFLFDISSSLFADFANRSWKMHHLMRIYCLDIYDVFVVSSWVISTLDDKLTSSGQGNWPLVITRRQSGCIQTWCFIQG